jgi:hypothetical protein
LCVKGKLYSSTSEYRIQLKFNHKCWE